MLIRTLFYWDDHCNCKGHMPRQEYKHAFCQKSALDIIFLIHRGELALLEAHGRGDLARRRVEVAHPIARDLGAVLGGEGKAELVGTLKLALKACKHKVLGTRRRAAGDSDRIL